MKQKVKLSTFCIILTVLVFVAMFAIIYFCIDNAVVTYLIGFLLLVWVNIAMCYMPLSISADDEFLYITRPYCIKGIPLADIDFVELCKPTMAERRICGSGGFFGYWGWFREPLIGKYFAYYGKASDCFLVSLKNGSKYLLGCQNAPTMVAYLQSRI